MLLQCAPTTARTVHTVRAAAPQSAGTRCVWQDTPSATESATVSLYISSSLQISHSRHLFSYIYICLSVSLNLYVVISHTHTLSLTLTVSKYICVFFFLFFLSLFCLSLYFLIRQNILLFQKR